jgi:hypothetical protein
VGYGAISKVWEGRPHPPTPQDPEWVPPHTPYPLIRTNNPTFFQNSMRITQGPASIIVGKSRPSRPITHNSLFKTRGKPGKPPANYTPRVRRKYILCKVKLGSPVVCNSSEPSIHAGSQPLGTFRQEVLIAISIPFLSPPPPTKTSVLINKYRHKNTPR